MRAGDRVNGRSGTHAAVAVAVALLLAGCGEDEPEPTADATGSPGPTGSSSPAEPGAEPARSSCEGTPGDGVGAELTQVLLEEVGDSIRVEFRTQEPVETRELLLYAVDAWDLDGEVGYQLGVEVRRGQTSGHYVRSFQVAEDDRPEDTELTEPVEMTGTSLTADFPRSALTDLGAPFKWSATLKIGPDPADSCPTVGEDPLDPARVVFPG
jgi:hypothetical protein